MGQDWAKDVAEHKTESDRKEIRARIVEAVGNNRQDPTRPILEDLASQGYEVVTWDSRNSAHVKCQELNDQQWTIEAFLTGLGHDAPMFERSHPGDTNCRIIVSGPDLQTLVIDTFGNIVEV